MPRIAGKIYKVARRVNNIEWYLTLNPILIFKHLIARKIIGHTRRFWSNIIYKGRIRW